MQDSKQAAENPDFECALYSWVVQQRAQNNILSGFIITEKARFYTEIDR